jgi:type II secretory pathway predicted ATPase ExeA
MFTGHFGLDEGPFHGKAEGDDVYVGPEQSDAIARLSKALASADSVITVTGPVGVGKTTLVRRALAELDGKKIIIPVDRLRLAPDEILELLLAKFDINRQPQGTIQRVAAFRRLLQEQLAAETRVFIVVEDAERIGVDALLELEALTSTDSGESCDAGIVLMGSPELLTRIASPALARLRQRVRLRQNITPFTATDVEGYMRHCISLAGGEFDDIFEPGTAQRVYRYSGGVARVVDTLCESALEAAAEAELATILPELVQQVAENCGLEPQFGDEQSINEQSLTDIAWHATPEVQVPVAREPEAFAPEVQALEAPEAEPPEAEPPEAEPPEAEPPEAEALVPEVGVPECGEPDVADTELSDDCPTMEAAALPAEEQSIPDGHGGPGAGSGSARSGITAGGILSEAMIPEAQVELLIDAAAEDSANIPTLSSSMRIEVNPGTDTSVRPIGLDEYPENKALQPASIAGTLPELALAPPITPEPGQPFSDESMIESPLVVVEEVSGQPQAAVEQAAVEIETPVDSPLVLETNLDTPAVELQMIDESGVDQLATDDSFAAANDERLEEPELDALEAAIHAANAWQSGDDQLQESTETNHAAGATDNQLLGITLDKVLEDKNRQESEPLRDLDQWAVELSKAQSLEDISDMLAETLFGNQELQQISDQIVANRPAANNTPAPPAPATVATPVKPAPVPEPAASATRKPPAAANGAAQPGRFDMTLSQRIDMVNTLKKGQSSRPAPKSNVTEIVLAVMPDAPEKPQGGPAPIEAQIDTAITQSRMALSSDDLARLAAEDKQRSASSSDKGSRGLFGLFKRSSKS